MTRVFDRRTLIKHASITAAALAASQVLPGFATQGQSAEIPNSSSLTPPTLVAPPNACDCHIHIMDKRFPAASAGSVVPAGMDVASYRQLQKRLGTQRVVIVQPKPYGINNDCILDAIAQFGGQARGIAVIKPDVSDTELEKLHAGGIRGVRFSVWNARDAVVSIDMLEPLAGRIKDLGWHVQLHMSGDQIIEHQALLERLELPMVFDHMGRLPPAQGIEHPAFKLIGELLRAEKAWVKLAGAYLNTASGAPYPDASNVARAFVQLAPRRLVWGSDWPHTTEPHKPDDSRLFDLLQDWAPGKALHRQILVDNPNVLYGFV